MQVIASADSKPRYRPSYFVQLSGSQAWPQVCASLSENADLRFGVLDGRNMEAFERSFPTAQFLDANAIKHGIWDRRRVASTPPEIRDHPAFIKREQQAYYGLQRHFTGGHISFTDMRVLLSSLTDFLWSYFEEQQFSFGLFTEAPHTHAGQILAGIAEAKSLPILFFQQTGISSAVRPVTGPEYKLVDYFSCESKDSRATRHTFLDQESGVREEFVEAAQRLVRYAAETSMIEREAKTFYSPKGLIRRFFIPYFWRKTEYALVTSSHVEHMRIPHSIQMMDPESSFVNSVVTRSASVSWRQSKQLREARRARGARETSVLPPLYATFFLQFEPERTSLPDGGIYGDQLLAIRACARALKDPFQLVVRDHPSQLTFAKRGFRTRSSAFYRELGSIDNVVLIGDRVPHEQVLAGSKAVITLTGKVALEALANKIPAIALGYPWYGGLPGVFRASVDEPLSLTVKKAFEFEFEEDYDLGAAIADLIYGECVNFRVNPGSDKMFWAGSAQDLDSMAKIVNYFALGVREGVI